MLVEVVVSFTTDDEAFTDVDVSFDVDLEIPVDEDEVDLDVDEALVFTIFTSGFFVGALFVLWAFEYVDAPIIIASSAAVADKASDLLWYKIFSPF